MELANSNTYVKIRENIFAVKKKEGVSFDDLYALIDCDMVELISMPHNIDLWVDEEGLLKENVYTEINIQNYDPIIIAGTGIFLSFNEDGYSTGLSAMQVEYIRENIVIRPYIKVIS